MDSYPSDLPDKQWTKLEAALESVLHKSSRGLPRKMGLRQLMNSLLYIVKTGCQWRYLPETFGNWKTIYSCFWRWQKRGVWKKLNDVIREPLRSSLNRNSRPSAAIIDSQSVKTTRSGRQRGYDAGKKIKGRKRHIAVDTLGLLLMVIVHSAGIQDRIGARAVIAGLFRDSHALMKIYADGGYRGKLIETYRTVS